MRSAAARATETGMTVDEVLTAWAEGGSIEGAAPSEPAEAQAAPPSVGETPTGPPAEQGDNPPEAQAATPPVGEAPTGPLTEQGDSTPSAPSRPNPAGKPPTLVGEPDRPMTVLAGVIGLFVAIVLVGLVGPSIATENPGARTSAIGYSEGGLQGQEIYQNLGCGSCHTQMVRPIVSDVGLGAVTLNDSNQVLGYPSLRARSVQRRHPSPRWSNRSRRRRARRPSGRGPLRFRPRKSRDLSPRVGHRRSGRAGTTRRGAPGGDP